MTVRRISPNLQSDAPADLAAFYADVFDMSVQMDMGWITFLDVGAPSATTLQVAREGGSGTDLPAISIEVDDLDAVLARLQAHAITPCYGPTLEPWGIRRFFFRDAGGNLVNVATHHE